MQIKKKENFKINIFFTLSEPPNHHNRQNIWQISLINQFDKHTHLWKGIYFGKSIEAWIVFYIFRIMDEQKSPGWEDQY